MTSATGTFDVNLNPQASTHPPLGRLSIDKSFHGDLEATSKGEMLAFSTAVEASAGYVAIEQVSGTLHGRRGTFALQHNGKMARGVGDLTIGVVPDSGTDDLTGVSGQMSIAIDEAGGHTYQFEYTFADAPSA